MPERKKGLFKKSPLLQVRGHRLLGRMPERKNEKKNFFFKFVNFNRSGVTVFEEGCQREKKVYLKSLHFNRSGVTVFEEGCQREKDE
ncbi:MAG: hypothetical protein ACRC2N_03755, partial [Aeromonas sp.]